MISFTKIVQASRLFSLPRVASANVAVREFASIEEKLKIPPRPKKPLTPFFRFLALNREKALSQNKDLKAMGVVQVVSKEWANVDQQLKAKLTDEYMKEKEDYTKIIAQYETKLTDEQKDGIRVAKQERVEGKEKRAHRKKVRENNKPKKPASGFLRFLTEEFATVKRKDDEDYRQFHTAIVEKWRKLPEAAKSKYNEAYKVDAEAYKQTLAKWELKMIRMGNEDLVRQEALIEQDGKQRKIRSRGTKSD